MAKGKLGPITMAVAGLGRAGWSIHVRAIRGRKDFVLTEVMDADPARLEEAKAEFGCRTFKDWRSFIKASEAELVVVATQSHDHAWMSLEALAAKHHVLTEKPAATRLADMDKLVAAAKKSRKLFTVHQNARLYPDYLQLQEIMRRGVLGRVFEIKRGGYGFARRNDWQTLRKYGGGQLNNNGVHLIDQVMQLLDAPVTAVFGDLQQILNPGDVEDHAKVVFRTEKGMLADVEVTQCALPLPAWVVLGTRGTLISDGQTVRLRYLAGKLKPLKPIDAKAVAGRRYGTGEKLEFKEETLPVATEMKRVYYDHLYDSIRKGKPLLVTPESVRNTMAVLRLARKGTRFP
jgi:scyllo-inositol 2-dehydrogenase (NADP+)